MKFLNCIECHDIQKLLVEEWRFCKCKKTAGRYLKDGKAAQIWGAGRILGVDNKDYAKSLKNIKFRGEWFMIFETNSRIHRVKVKPTG